MESKDEENKVSRRTFLSYVNVALGSFIGAVLGIPLIGSVVLPALRASPPATLSSAGPSARFPPGLPTGTTVTVVERDGWIEQTGEKGVWVVRRAEREFTVYNGRCTHLGCAYNWNPQAKEFQCPCHGGRYNVDGVVLGGPPPRPLDTLEWRVEQDTLQVAYQDFRLGIPQKEAA